MKIMVIFPDKQDFFEMRNFWKITVSYYKKTKTDLLFKKKVVIYEHTFEELYWYT